MKPTPFIACNHPDRGGDYWICRTCGEQFPFKPGIPHCEPEAPDGFDRVVIAISVGTFSMLIVAAWAFCYAMGWLK